MKNEGLRLKNNYNEKDTTWFIHRKYKKKFFLEKCKNFVVKSFFRKYFFPPKPSIFFINLKTIFGNLETREIYEII